MSDLFEKFPRDFAAYAQLCERRGVKPLVTPEQFEMALEHVQRQTKPPPLWRDILSALVDPKAGIRPAAGFLSSALVELQLSDAALPPREG